MVQKYVCLLSQKFKSLQTLNTIKLFLESFNRKFNTS